ncbi:MAG: ABC transporter substrate-binding protein [Burkholderiaceae bacterium]
MPRAPLHRLIVLLACLLALGCARSSDPDQAHHAASTKVLRYALPAAEVGFDPVQISDIYSRTVTSNIFESLLTYDYLARPAVLRPLVAQALPEVTDNFTTFTFRIRPGIYFADDPAFKGQRREVVAEDFAYMLKRIHDPQWRSPFAADLEQDQILGLAQLRKAAQEPGKSFDYDAPVEGLKVLDRYTLRIKLAQPRPRFAENFAGASTAAMAREVVQRYGQDIMAHPVGTGPFKLVQWQRGLKIVLERNPSFREQIFDAQPAADNAAGQQMAKALAGKRLPLLDRVELSIVQEAQPRWLTFLNGGLDTITLPGEFAAQAVSAGGLTPVLAKRGIRMQRLAQPDLIYTQFNMEDPLVGGYTPEKVALRRAIALAYDTAMEIRLIRKGLAVPARGFFAPTTTGHDLTPASPIGEYDPAKAKALLDMFGYIDRDGDGWRETPQGAPLILRFSTTSEVSIRAYNEQWERALRAIGLRVQFEPGLFPAQMSNVRAGNYSMWSQAFLLGSPNPEAMFALADGASVGGANTSRFDLPAYNALMLQQRDLPDGAQRQALLNQANQLLAAYVPMKPHVHRVAVYLAHPWVVGYQVHPFAQASFWRYVDIDIAAKQAATR